MFHVLIWGLVAGLLALWSLAAWALHATLQWAMAQAGSLDVAVSLPQVLSLPPALSVWIPADSWAAAQAWLAAGVQGLEALATWLPSVSGGLGTGLTVLVIGAWALGVAALLLLGGVGSGLVAWLARRSAQAGAMARPAGQLLAPARR